VTGNIEAGGLAMAAVTAGFAPSVDNSQPWRWRLSDSALELWAARDRQLPITDPVGRFLTLSCGAALHHACLALAAEGWQVTVNRLPDPTQPDLLARLSVAQPTEMTSAAMRLLQTARIRHTDRRPVSDTPVDPASIDHLAKVADHEGAHLHVLRRNEVIKLAEAASRARQVEGTDEAWQEELAYWSGGERSEGLGVPDQVIPSTPPLTTVTGQESRPTGKLPVGPGHDREAVYAILYGDEDAKPAWLQAGEALSAVWLDAVEQDLNVLPLSAAVEVLETRQILRHLLANLGQPFLALRVGVDADHDGPPPTPRLPAAQTIDIAS
jgi:hypothetical protein